ncbi:hypothetical protein EV715DRAFT_196517 [Schizophyllum commune]
MRLAAVAIAALALLAGVAAQDDDNNSNSQSGTRTRSADASNTSGVSLSRTTSVTTITTRTRSGDDTIQTTFVSSSVFSVSVTATSSSSSASASATEAPSADNTFLETKIDPAFGVLGAILIITGLPSTFWGHKNRWTSFFITGFYTLALVCFVLITKFGILPAINPPSKTVRGMFVLACGVAGIAGGGVAIFFWKASRYAIGGWGGFALGLWIQCFRDGGLISNVGLRWILYIGAGVVGFVLCTIPKIHYHVLLVSTAFIGASATILGIDCFTTANLKEFYVWNLGFESLFPKFKNNGIKFPVGQVMQIELGLIGAIALMGIAVQLRILSTLQVKLKEIQEEQRKRERQADLDGADRFAMIEREREQWEREHPTFSKHDRAESGLSTVPLMKYQDGSSSPMTEHSFANEDRKRRPSGLSDLMASPAPEEEKERAARGKPTVALPDLDLGFGIEDDVPKDFITKDQGRPQPPPQEMQKRDDLLAEIDNLRRSIDALRTETPDLSTSHRPSLTSRRTLSTDAAAALLPAAHLRPPRTGDPRARTHSMELSTLAGQNSSAGESIGRPTSAPLRDVDWDQYVAERKLLQPPAGITPPIPTTSPGPLSPTQRISMAPAVAEALRERKLRESALYTGPRNISEDDVPLAQQHGRSRSAGGNIPTTILPPKAAIHAPKPQRLSSTPRTATFEELNERHREHLHQLQAPITQAQKDQAELDAAKARWEKSKAAERDAVAKRQAEKAARLREGGRSESRDNDDRRRQRSLSADKLNALGNGSGHSKRLSTMKVEDWQQRQQVGETGYKHERGPSGSGGRTRDSRAGVPFPDTKRPPRDDRRAR